ncbi:hypothetical protein BDP27DRAFT_1322229 [Rhodocollybia butyracea]|uniref:Uncharacterized protein n=1 Tax=Rhodocollybia butyracea TaxID=206335 RepID=A0A9P5PZT3_9AGAR|nr:hypothetical protein BDP27DRAFT_1322229 [Rhodocollybia butyracea]
MGRSGGVGIGVDFSRGKETLWREVKLETVECEVPVGVCSGEVGGRLIGLCVLVQLIVFRV